MKNLGKLEDWCFHAKDLLDIFVPSKTGDQGLHQNVAAAERGEDPLLADSGDEF